MFNKLSFSTKKNLKVNKGNENNQQSDVYNAQFYESLVSTVVVIKCKQQRSQNININKKTKKMFLCL